MCQNRILSLGLNATGKLGGVNQTVFMELESKSIVSLASQKQGKSIAGRLYLSFAPDDRVLSQRIRPI